MRPFPRLGFGVQIACSGMHVPEFLDIARAADELGYHILGVPDHYVATPDGVDPSPHTPLIDGWTALGAIAQGTSRIRLGPFVASNSFRHPAILAKMAASLDHISHGRLEVGLGIGWFDFEHTSFGLPFPPVPERLRSLSEAIEIVRGLWTEPEFSFEGEFYHLEKAVAEPKPLQQPAPPLLLASSGPKVGLRMVAKHADHWNTYRPPEQWGDLSVLLDEHCARQGRDPKEVTRSAMIPVYLEEDDAVRRKIAMFGHRDWFLVGSDEEIRDRIGRFVDAGADLIVLQVDAPRGNVETLRAFAERFFDAGPASRSP